MKRIVSVLCFLLLAACQEDQMSYQDLMQHPAALQKSVEQCQAATTAYCDDVRRAQHNFTALVQERMADPEIFGQKVIEAQQGLVQLQQAFLIAQQSGDATKLDLAQQAYDKKNDEIKTLYAVILATSPGSLGGE